MEEVTELDLTNGDWDYRVFRIKDRENIGYIIREVFCDFSGEPVFCSYDSITSFGASMDELVDDLFIIADAIHQPILELAEGDQIIEATGV